MQNSPCLGLSILLQVPVSPERRHDKEVVAAHHIHRRSTWYCQEGVVVLPLRPRVPVLLMHSRGSSGNAVQWLLDGSCKWDGQGMT